MGMTEQEEHRLAREMAVELGLADPPSMKVIDDDMSHCRIILDAEGKPDAHNPNLPGSPTIRPKRVMILLYPADGMWECSLAQVIGPKVAASTGRVTIRNYDTTFVSVMDPDSHTPEWIFTEAVIWQNRLNGAAQ